MRRLTLVLTFVLCAFPGAALADTSTQLGPGALQRYFSGTSATHWVTTGPTSAGYAYEFGVGYQLGTSKTTKVRIRARR